MKVPFFLIAEGLPWLTSSTERAGKYYPYLVHRRKAEILEHQGDWDPAEAIYRQNLAWLEAHGFERQSALSRMKLGWVMHKKGMGKEALEQLALTEPHLKEDNSKKDLCNLFNKTGNAHYRLGDYGKSERYFAQSLALAREAGDPEQEAHAENNLGNVYGDLGDTEKALEHYRKSYDIGEKIGDVYNNGKTAGNIAWCLISTGDYAQAMEWYQRQAAVAGSCGDKHLLSVAVGNMAVVFLHRRELQQARGYIQKRLELADELGDRRGMSVSLSHLAQLHRMEGDLPKADGFARQAIALARELGAKYFLSMYLNELAQLLCQMSRGEEAEALNDESLALARELAVPKLMVEASILKSKLVSGKEPKKAREMLEELEGIKVEPHQEAKLHLALFRLTGSEEHRAKALEWYRSHSGEEEWEDYGEIVAELEAQK